MPDDDTYFEKKARQLDRDERPSWREKDARKEGKSYQDSKPSGYKQQQAKRKDAAAKQALEGLFAPKKKDKEQEKAWKALQKLSGKERDQELQSYIDRYGFPKDWDDVFFVLDASDEGLLEKAIAQLQASFEDQTPSKRKLCGGKLAITKLSVDDSDVLEDIETLIKKIENAQ